MSRPGSAESIPSNRLQPTISPPSRLSLPALLLVDAVAAISEAAPDRPNIVFMFAEDESKYTAEPN